LAKRATLTVRSNGASSSVIKAMQELAKAMNELTLLSGRDELRYWQYDLRVLERFTQKIDNVNTIIFNKRNKLHLSINGELDERLKDESIG
jgi:hypothetical protein